MVEGILLLYHHPIRAEAPTLREHVDSFAKYSRLPVWPVNVELGFPPGLASLRFRTIILHYSPFGDFPFRIREAFSAYVKDSKESHVVAFFQDEYQFCPQRFAFLDEHHVRTVFTLLDAPYSRDVYLGRTSVQEVYTTLTGFVDDSLIDLARRLGKTDEDRTIDISYRSRRLPYRMGKGAQEKTDIAYGFLRHVGATSLVLDIKPGSTQRISGDSWYEYLSNCRGVIGVEAGVSVFDLEDKVRQGVEALLIQNPDISFEEMSERLLLPWEGNVPYRTISPRHFEAAAFRVCQVLFEGKYSDILVPMRHYIPLKKDFSNIKEVLRLFSDPAVRKQITDQAYEDLIASGRYSYRKFIAGVDEVLLQGISAKAVSAEEIGRVDRVLARGRYRRVLRSVWLGILFKRFPGRSWMIRRWKGFKIIFKRIVFGQTVPNPEKHDVM